MLHELDERNAKFIANFGYRPQRWTFQTPLQLANVGAVKSDVESKFLLAYTFFGS